MRKEVIGDAVLYHGDCREIIPALPRLDAVITDPPYSSGGNFRSDRTRSTADKYIGGGYVEGSAALDRQEFSGDNKDQRAYLVWSEMWMSRALERAAPGAIIAAFTDWRQLPVTTDAVQCGGWVWRGLAIWDKTEAARPQKGWFRNQCEYVVWGSNGPMAMEGECHPGVFRQAVLAEGKDHIAGKPVAVMEGIVRISRPGGLVLDPFMGSGTTGVACVAQNRPFIGIEIEPRYFDIACRRIEQAYKQRPLFDAEPPKKPEQLEIT